jgi:hypothetical protein
MRFGSFNGYDLIFKKEKEADKLTRFRLSAGKLNFKKVNDQNTYNVLTSMGFGTEKRIPIAYNFS